MMLLLMIHLKLETFLPFCNLAPRLAMTVSYRAGALDPGRRLRRESGTLARRGFLSASPGSPIRSAGSDPVEPGRQFPDVERRLPFQ
jgi:hypothetical protein